MVRLGALLSSSRPSLTQCSSPTRSVPRHSAPESRALATGRVGPSQHLPVPRRSQRSETDTRPSPTSADNSSKSTGQHHRRDAGINPGLPELSTEGSPHAATEAEGGPPYWFIGAYYGGRDQTQSLVEHGTWSVSETGDYADEVNSTEPNERFAIKATYVRSRPDDLRFGSKGHPVSVMAIKATGTVTGQPIRC